METTIIERIKLVCKKKEFSFRQFAIKIDFNYTTFNNYLIVKNKSINIDLICKILVTFPDISAEWLLLGVGTMYKDAPVQVPGGNDTLLMKTIIELSGKNALLEEKVKELEENKTGYGMVAEKIVKYGKQ